MGTPSLGFFCASLALAIGLVTSSATHECGCFENEVEKGTFAVMCAVVGIPGVPSRMVGWGGVLRKWGAATCGDCQRTFGKFRDILKSFKHSQFSRIF